MSSLVTPVNATGRDSVPDSMPDRDYSSVPLWSKLGLRPGSRWLLEGAPQSLTALDDLPDFVQPATTQADVMLVFATATAVVEDAVTRFLPQLADRGGLWIAWPKKTSSTPNSVDFQSVQAIGLAAGLVDNKTCRIDDDWQAIRFVRRLKK